MSDYKEITTEDFIWNLFKRIAKDWMLITAEKMEKPILNDRRLGWFGSNVGKRCRFLLLSAWAVLQKEFCGWIGAFFIDLFQVEDHKRVGLIQFWVSGRDEDKLLKASDTGARWCPVYFKEGNLSSGLQSLRHGHGSRGFHQWAGLDENGASIKTTTHLYVGETEKAGIKQHWFFKAVMKFSFKEPVWRRPKRAMFH